MVVLIILAVVLVIVLALWGISSANKNEKFNKLKAEFDKFKLTAEKTQQEQKSEIETYKNQSKRLSDSLREENSKFESYKKQVEQNTFECKVEVPASTPVHKAISTLLMSSSKMVKQHKLCGVEQKEGVSVWSIKLLK